MNVLGAKDLQELKNLKFGKVIETIVSDTTPLIDFDSGRVSHFKDFIPTETLKKIMEKPRRDRPERRRDEGAMLDLIAKAGLDAVGDAGSKIRGLVGFDMVALPRSPRCTGDWENASPGRVVERLASSRPGTPAAMTAKGHLPETYFIQTREGGVGILQITGFVPKPHQGIEIRYKMIEGLPTRKAPTTETTEECVPAVSKREASFGDVVEKTMSDGVDESAVIDFDTGNIGKIPEAVRAKGEAAVFGWMSKEGFDAMSETDANIRGLVGVDMVAHPRSPRFDSNWKSAPPWRVSDKLSWSKLGTPAIITAKYGVPATYVIRTRKGGLGVLQIIWVSIR